MYIILLFKILKFDLKTYIRINITRWIKITRPKSERTCSGRCYLSTGDAHKQITVCPEFLRARFTIDSSLNVRYSKYSWINQLTLTCFKIRVKQSLYLTKTHHNIGKYCLCERIHLILYIDWLWLRETWIMLDPRTEMRKFWFVGKA